MSSLARASSARPWTWRAVASVFLLGVLVRAPTLLLVQQPGYMDASYYYHVAENLLAGRGLVQDVVWNFLDPSADLPRPSNQYWPPGTSLIAAAGGWLLGPGFRHAQVPMVLLAAAMVSVAYVQGALLLGTRRGRWGVAALVLSSAAYYPYWVTTDNFAPYGFLGAACFLALGYALRGHGWALLPAGVLAGWAQAVRPDGLLLALIVVGAAATVGRSSYRIAPSPRRRRVLWAARWVSVALAAYGVGAGPWYVRNWLTWGSPLPMVGGQTMFLRAFEDMSAYGVAFTPARLLAAGWWLVVGQRLHGLLGNLIPLFQPMLFALAPLTALGARRLWRQPAARPALIYVGLVYVLLSLAFPTISPRGSLFHSLTPALPVLYAATIRGLDAAVAWAGAWRRWHIAEAQVVFLIASVVLQVGGAAYLGWRFHEVRGWETDIARPAAAWLDTHAAPGEAVLFVDPPAFYLVARRPAIMVPSNGRNALVAVARRFRAPWLIVAPKGPRYLSALYNNRVRDADLSWVADVGDARVYRVHLMATADPPEAGGNRGAP